MTPEEAVKVVRWHRSEHGSEPALYGWQTIDEAEGFCLKLAEEALAKRKQPNIATVLDELEDLCEKHDYLHFQECLDRIRDKYCPPKPEKPTLKSAITQIVEHHKEWCNNDCEVKFWNKLLDQLKEIKE